MHSLECPQLCLPSTVCTKCLLCVVPEPRASGAMDDHVAGSAKEETEHTWPRFSRVCHPSVHGKQKGKCPTSAGIIGEDFPEEAGLELDPTE